MYLIKIYAAVAGEVPGHVFAAGTETRLGQPEALECLWLCSLSLGQSDRWIYGQGFEEMLSFTEIRL